MVKSLETINSAPTEFVDKPHRTAMPVVKSNCNNHNAMHAHHAHLDNNSTLKQTHAQSIDHHAPDVTNSTTLRPIPARLARMVKSLETINSAPTEFVDKPTKTVMPVVKSNCNNHNAMHAHHAHLDKSSTLKQTHVQFKDHHAQDVINSTTLRLIPARLVQVDKSQVII
jgi:hypothetical protein